MNISLVNWVLLSPFILLLIGPLCFAQTIIDRNTSKGKVREIYYDNIKDKVIYWFKPDTAYSSMIAYSDNENVLYSYSTCGIESTHLSVYDGAYIQYYKSGQVKSIEYYECGIATGVWSDFFESGKLKSQRSFVYDSIDLVSSEIEYDITFGGEGISSSSTTMFAGLPNGKWLEWYKNGNLASEKYFNHGLEEKTWIWYYENGNKRKEGGFYSDTLMIYPDKVKIVVSPEEKEDKMAAWFFPHIRPKHGKWTEWNKEGVLKLERYYDKGQLINEVKF